MIELLDVVVLASGSSSDDGGPGWLLLAGPIGGIAFYGAVFRYYRNTDKSHGFETETVVSQTAPITGEDLKVDEIRRTRRAEIEGGNAGNHRVRVQRVEPGS